MKKLEACKQVVIADLKEKIIAAADKQREMRDYEKRILENRLVVDGKPYCPWKTDEERYAAARDERCRRIHMGRPVARLLLVTYAFLRGVPLVKVEGVHRFDVDSYTRVLSKKIEDIVSGLFKDELKGPLVAYLTKGLKEWLEAEEPTKLAECSLLHERRPRDDRGGVNPLG